MGEEMPRFRHAIWTRLTLSIAAAPVACSVVLYLIGLMLNPTLLKWKERAIAAEIAAWQPTQSNKELLACYVHELNQYSCGGPPVTLPPRFKKVVTEAGYHGGTFRRKLNSIEEILIQSELDTPPANLAASVLARLATSTVFTYRMQLTEDIPGVDITCFLVRARELLDERRLFEEETGTLLVAYARNMATAEDRMTRSRVTVAPPASTISGAQQ